MEKLDKIVEISSESKMKTEIDPRSKTSANRNQKKRLEGRIRTNFKRWSEK
jgi:hypothetical protein